MKQIKDGVWVTMLTPFTEDNRIYYPALEKLIEWYIRCGVSGLFSVCQSSEMLFLSARERAECSRFVARQVNGRIGVVTSGHISDSFSDQLDELKAAADSGSDAVVLVSNRLAAQEQSEDVFKANTEKILNAMPDVTFGFYECPKPYKRVLSAELFGWCASTGRFAFLKDTCCDMAQITAKLAAAEGTGVKLFNANSATLLQSLRSGASGFCGVMANFHPDIYAWLCENYEAKPQEAEAIQSFLTVCSLMELQLYPVNAKYYLNKFYDIPMSKLCRSADASAWNTLRGVETDAVYTLSEEIRKKYGV